MLGEPVPNPRVRRDECLLSFKAPADSRRVLGRYGCCCSSSGLRVALKLRFSWAPSDAGSSSPGEHQAGKAQEEVPCTHLSRRICVLADPGLFQLPAVETRREVCKLQSCQK